MEKTGRTLATSAQLLERFDPVFGSIGFGGFDARQRRMYALLTANELQRYEAY